MSTWKKIYISILVVLVIVGIILKDWMLPALLLSTALASSINPGKSRAKKAVLVVLFGVTIVLGWLYLSSLHNR